MTTPVNHDQMLEWAAGIEKIIAKPPGSDEGFSPEDIATYTKADFSTMSSWAIVCEEVLDTQFPRVYFELAYREMRLRGISNREIKKMRRFAWLTAGWLNYVKMVWDWASMDEQDIWRAIDWQYSEGWITAEERKQRLRYLNQYKI